MTYKSIVKCLITIAVFIIIAVVLKTINKSGFLAMESFLFIVIFFGLLLLIATLIVLKNFKRNKDKENPVLYWISFLASAAIIVLTVIHFFFMPTFVIGESMENALYDGDRVIVSHFNYSPQNGDIVVVKISESEDYVKRVVAVAGDKINLDYKIGLSEFDIYFNDSLYQRGRVSLAEWANITGQVDLSTLSYEIVVPVGYLVVFGDNFEVSLDSRSKLVGLLPISRIKGKVIFKIWPIGAVK